MHVEEGDFEPISYVKAFFLKAMWEWALFGKYTHCTCQETLLDISNLLNSLSKYFFTVFVYKSTTTNGKQITTTWRQFSILPNKKKLFKNQDLDAAKQKIEDQKIELEREKNTIPRHLLWRIQRAEAVERGAGRPPRREG